MNNEKREFVLLKATLEILKKCKNSPYVLNVLSTSAIWDGVECDGYCLMEEIKELLEEQGIILNDND